MKVLLINGSPHEKGCTYTALSLIAGELKAQGIETEILHVGGQPVGGCIGCGGCRSGNGCVFGGVVNEAIEKAKTADAFVFGSPVHYASAAGNMASFMDRLAYAGGKYLAYKPAAVCCSARRAGTTSTLDQLVKYPQFFHMPLVNGSYWAMVHGSNPEQVLQDAEGCAVMQELGRNMAWLLHCIEAGKAAGIDHPQNPPYVSPVEPFRHRLSFLFSSYPSPLPLTPSHQRIVQHHQKLHRGRCAGQWVACQLLHMFRACVPCDLCGSTNRALNDCPVAVILF